MVDQTVYRETELAILYTKLTALEDMIYTQAVTIANLEGEVDKKPKQPQAGEEAFCVSAVADLLQAYASKPIYADGIRRVARLLNEMRPFEDTKIHNVRLLKRAFGLSLRDAKHLFEDPSGAVLTYQPEATE